MNLKIGDKIFAVTLEDNESAREFAKKFPIDEEFEELNGNEKYFRLSGNLPTDEFRPGQIHAGDLMLFGSNCVVIFYKDFSSNYSYTKLGKIDNPAGLLEAGGKGNIRVRLDK